MGFCMMGAAGSAQVAYDIHKQKLSNTNQPLLCVHFSLVSVSCWEITGTYQCLQRLL